jgi:hypothetical protein
VDSDAEKSEVYAIDSADGLLYGFSYKAEGDKATVDFGSGKRKKFSIVDFNEGDQTVAFSFAQELADLRKFKAEKEADERANAENKLFSRFQDLANLGAFNALKADCAKLSLGEIEEKCFSLRGRAAALPAKEKAKNKLPVEKFNFNGRGEKEPYGGLFDKYGKE